MWHNPCRDDRGAVVPTGFIYDYIKKREDMIILNIKEILAKKNLTLPEAPAAVGLYSQVREFGVNMCYVSGCLPNIPGVETFAGKVGGQYTLEDGQRAAQMAMLNMLAIMQKNLGDLSRIKRIVKLTCFVACESDFYQQPAVANAASQLLLDIFGEEKGKAARSAVGVNALPLNAPFEIEMLAELES